MDTDIEHHDLIGCMTKKLDLIPIVVSGPEAK
jgi:hypothetical protein